MSGQGSCGRKLSEATISNPTIGTQPAQTSFPFESIPGSQIKTIPLDDVVGSLPATLPVTETTAAGTASEAPTEASFCSNSDFTLDEAVAFGEAVMRKGSKPLGFHGTPYASLAPWTCQGKVTVSTEVRLWPQRSCGNVLMGVCARS